jgi:hypothetical protein
MHPTARAHRQFGASFDSSLFSREGAKNAKEKACDGFSVPSLAEDSFFPLDIHRAPAYAYARSM